MSQENDIKLLVDLLFIIETKEDYEKFLLDLLSPAEFDSITQRLQIAKMLQEGKKYSEITKETKASTTTISRVNKVLSTSNNMLYNTLRELKQEKREEI